MLNHKVFQNAASAKKQILVVTKYWNQKITQDIILEVTKNYPDIFYGIGENRIENIREKQLPRDLVHFIGNIQSQKIPDIVSHCGVIHSLSNLKHAQRIENQGKKISVFIQIQIDPQKPIGISSNQFESFLERCKEFKNLKVIGISGMGSSKYSETEKREEFQKLLRLRNKYLPNGLISAGTSRDYEIALEEGIDVVRVGQKVLTEV